MELTDELWLHTPQHLFRVGFHNRATYKTLSWETILLGSAILPDVVWTVPTQFMEGHEMRTRPFLVERFISLEPILRSWAIAGIRG